MGALSNALTIRIGGGRVVSYPYATTIWLDERELPSADSSVAMRIGHLEAFRYWLEINR